MRKLKNSELNRIDISTFKSIKKTPLIVVLDDIRSLNNIGSIFRTCDAFKIEKLYLCGITATPPNRKITKTATGHVRVMPHRDGRIVFQESKEYKGQNKQQI